MATPSNILDGSIWEDVALSVQAEAADAINVILTAKQTRGLPGGKPPKLVGYVSDNSDGSTTTATAPDTLAIKSGGYGVLTEHVSNKVFSVELTGPGRADIEFGENGTPTWYLVIVKPDGTKVVSSAITFA